ncbi:prolyl oligopeptidase [Fimicolochytrium jonesii]|uniref:prolyl oligopeptidase n=1 Tax=Fimicolochytrium jonesii TaxID=1396493 RepID=UPI0022FF1A08|nr:prolyl oligopeptidase [Fimicolochytrium jonesii]KAI8820687.1 prolyl oligopeptidase [Fimicolochytrium jonesii]
MSRPDLATPLLSDSPPVGSTRRATLKLSEKQRSDSISRQASIGQDIHTPRHDKAHSTLHPPLANLPALDEYIKSEPSNLVQVVPAIGHFLEEFCLANPDSCAEVWEKLRELIAEVQTKNDPKEPPRPPSPVCQRKPEKSVNIHGETWEDDYGWLTDRENPEVLDYIQRENDYASTVLEHTKPLQKLLYKEFVSRIDEEEHSAHVTMQDGWTYYRKKSAGQEYHIHCRSKEDAGEEVYLDENVLANSPEFVDASYFRVGFLKHSPDGKLIAYGIDSTGNERQTTYFMDMESRTLLPDRIEGVYEDLEFAHDNSVFYTILDDTERAYKFLRHKLGTKVEDDELLYHEEDEMFFLSMTKTCNGRFILLNTAAQVTSETRIISTREPDLKPMLLFPRRENIQYMCENHGAYFYVLTNEDSKNNWLFRIPLPKAGSPTSASIEELVDSRETVIEHRDFVLIETFEMRRNRLIVFERSNCLQNVRIVDLSNDGFNSYHYISFGEMVYSLWPGTVREEERAMAKASQFDTNIFRFTYTSFVQPKQVVDYNMDDRTMTVVYEEHIGGYDRSMYSSRRLFATSVDGTAVPISIVYRRDLVGQNMDPPEPNPCLLHAYGAYGAFVNPIFSASRLSLLDRGFIYAAAHVRGGADMGKGWYEEGKLAKKPNTFLDFCAVAEYLCKEGYTSPSKLGIYGRSAGGLLIGAVINMRPDLFAAALTEVPFVDVINTMFDSSIPWTAFEWEEWGNPTDKDIYDVMKMYCPYTNIRGQALANNAYPHLLVVGGMNDPRVAFFEPLKFVAKMRGEKRRWKNILKSSQKDKSRIATLSEGDEETNNASTPGGTSRKNPAYLSLPAMAGGTSNDADVPPKPTHSNLLLRIEDAGHGGSSGQYSFLENLAYEYAFIITSLNAPGTETAPSSLASFGSAEEDEAMYWAADGEAVQNGMERRRKKMNRRGLEMTDIDEKEYRRKNKGDRGPSDLFQVRSTAFRLAGNHLHLAHANDTDKCFFFRQLQWVTNFF